MTRGSTLWLTGLPSSGKTTIATELARTLPAAVQVLDGDALRGQFFPELGFTPADRVENIRRTGRLATMFAAHGVTVLVPVIAPYRSARHWVRDLHAEAGLDYAEIWVDAPVEVCAARDVKGLYAKARRGELRHLTGLDAPYEAPEDPELRLRTDVLPLAECVRRVHSLLDTLATRRTAADQSGR